MLRLLYAILDHTIEALVSVPGTTVQHFLTLNIFYVRHRSWYMGKIAFRLSFGFLDIEVCPFNLSILGVCIWAYIHDTAM